MNTRLMVIEDWRRETEIAKKAVAEYQSQQDVKRRAALEAKKSKEWVDLLKQGSVVLGIIIAILYAYAASRGIKL